jgi:hypothetical protein
VSGIGGSVRRAAWRSVVSVRERFGRRSLQGDALYCAALGATLLVLCRPVGRRVAVAPAVVGLGGAATLLWAYGLAALSRRRLVVPLAVVGTANAIAATTLVAAATRQPRPTGRRLLTATGAEVAAFAATQALALALSENRAA